MRYGMRTRQPKSAIFCRQDAIDSDTHLNGKTRLPHLEFRSALWEDSMKRPADISLYHFNGGHRVVCAAPPMD